jgi:hypothetical protein
MPLSAHLTISDLIVSPAKEFVTVKAKLAQAELLARSAQGSEVKFICEGLSIELTQCVCVFSYLIWISSPSLSGGSYSSGLNICLKTLELLNSVSSSFSSIGAFLSGFRSFKSKLPHVSISMVGR